MLQLLNGAGKRPLTTKFELQQEYTFKKKSWEKCCLFKPIAEEMKADVLVKLMKFEFAINQASIIHNEKGFAGDIST